MSARCCVCELEEKVLLPSSIKKVRNPEIGGLDFPASVLKYCNDVGE